MKLKRLLATTFAAAALVASFATPLAYADSDSVNGHSTVNEIGTFDYFWWYGTSGSGTGFNFEAADVDTINGDVVGGLNALEIEEMRASSPGWTLTISATNFDGPGSYEINKANLSVTALNLSGGHQNCLGVLAPLPENPFQTIGSNVGSLATDFALFTATAGRGCGSFYHNVVFQLNVPAGTHTGGTSANYTSMITLTDTAAPS